MKQGKIRIIHLEDMSADAELVKRELKKSGIEFEITHVKNKTDFLKAISENQVDVILCDHSLPSFSSIDAFKLVRQNLPRLPFILVTATVSEEFAVNMMNEGIDDYVLKDRLQRLPAAISNAIDKITFEKEKEKHLNELVRQEKKFRTMIENMEDIIGLADQNFKIFYRSPAAYRIFGKSQSEFESQDFIGQIHPDDLNYVRAKMQDLISSPGVVQDVTLRSRHKNGHYIWLEGTLINLLKDDNVNAILINLKDITSKKEAKELLIQNEKYYRALINNISDAIVVVSGTGTVWYNSPSVKQITGFEEAETLNHSIFDFVHPEDLDLATQTLTETYAKPGVPVYNSIRIRHKDGHYIWAEGTANNQLHEESVRGIIINYRNINERKISEQLLQKSQATLQTVVNNAAIAYVVLDKDFNIMSFNELARIGYLKEFNKPLKEGAYLFDYLPDERKEVTHSMYLKVLDGESLRYETSFNQPDGHKTWYSMNVFPVFDNTRKLLGLIISTEDITHRRNNEIEKEKMTSEIIQHNKNLEQFAYVISHNLRSPVANILGISYILKNSSDMSQEDHIKCLDGLISSVNKLDDVIIDLNFILQKRRDVLEKKEKVNLNQLVTDIKTLISNQIKQENIDIRTNFSHTENLFAIKSYLHSIFLNLISNSIKYRKPDVSAFIEITSTNKEDKIIICFRDNGLGINLDLYGDKIFGLYKKFHTHIEGKGMGLYIVKTQVELLNGRIDINSKVGEGTTFIIEFEAQQVLSGA